MRESHRRTEILSARWAFDITELHAVCSRDSTQKDMNSMTPGLCMQGRQAESGMHTLWRREGVPMDRRRSPVWRSRAALRVRLRCASASCCANSGDVNTLSRGTPDTSVRSAGAPLLVAIGRYWCPVERLAPPGAWLKDVLQGLLAQLWSCGWPAWPVARSVE